MTSSTVHFKRVALIGIGLIGSSLARVMRRDNLADHIVINARTQKSLDTATDLGLADSTTLDPAEAVKGADLVVFCTPIGSYEALAKTIVPNLETGCIVSDVGSVKKMVIDILAPLMPDGVQLVPGHPIAGTEHSGPEAGFAELFQDRWCILTPAKCADQTAVDKVTALWTAANMKVEIMDAVHHDHVLAITSHLPHLIAYTIVGTATDLADDLEQEVVKYSASGFRDFTRIAASDPTMWRDIFLNNREAVLDILGRFSEDLTAMQRAIRHGEGDTLADAFTRTREIRRKIIDAKQD
jgi:cyclohexadieny/prephenate dehydrogenase